MRMPKFDLVRLTGVICAAALTLVTALCYARSEVIDIQNSVLRLHIVAEDDSAEAQELKLKIRDEVIARCGFLFEDCADLDECVRTAQNNIGFIKYVASSAAEKNGSDAEITCTVGRTEFPQKKYVRRSAPCITLPGGEYTALNITIGGGKGKNWWCVMYPPLCFADDAVVQDGDSTLRDTLSASEYDMVTETERPEIKLKLKLAEMLNDRRGE